MKKVIGLLILTSIAVSSQPALGMEGRLQKVEYYMDTYKDPMNSPHPYASVEYLQLKGGLLKEAKESRKHDTVLRRKKRIAMSVAIVALTVVVVIIAKLLAKPLSKEAQCDTAIKAYEKDCTTRPVQLQTIKNCLANKNSLEATLQSLGCPQVLNEEVNGIVKELDSQLQLSQISEQLEKLAQAMMGNELSAQDINTMLQKAEELNNQAKASGFSSAQEGNLVTRLDSMIQKLKQKETDAQQAKLALEARKKWAVDLYKSTSDCIKRQLSTTFLGQPQDPSTIDCKPALLSKYYCCQAYDNIKALQKNGFDEEAKDLKLQRLQGIEALTHYAHEDDKAKE